MDKGWVRLTPGDEDGDGLAIYREIAGGYRLNVGIQRDGEIRNVFPYRLKFLSTLELANIPWVKALIVAGRKEVENKRIIHAEADRMYRSMACSPELGAALEDLLPSEDEDKALNGLIAALKPFAGVDYE